MNKDDTLWEERARETNQAMEEERAKGFSIAFNKGDITGDELQVLVARISSLVIQVGKLADELERINKLTEANELLGLTYP